MEKSNIIIEDGEVYACGHSINNFGENAYKVADRIKELGAKYCEINIIIDERDEWMSDCSIGQFIGNDSFIDFDLLKDDNFLEENDYKSIEEGNNEEREKVLRIAYKNSKGILDKKLNEFMLEHIKWLDDYSLYMAVKNVIAMDSICDWKVYKSRNANDVKSLRYDFEDDINYYIFVQYEFHKQWRNLKNYFNDLGVSAKRVYRITGK